MLFSDGGRGLAPVLILLFRIAFVAINSRTAIKKRILLNNIFTFQVDFYAINSFFFFWKSH